MAKKEQKLFNTYYEKYKNVGFVIQVDTREHENKNIHLLDFFEQNNIIFFEEKLDIGDYANIYDMSIIVDRKQNILELINNVTQDHVRFRNECIRAQEQKIKLIILVEEYLNSIYDLQYWKSKIWSYGPNKGKPYTQMKGQTLMKILLTMQNKYGVEFRFCHKEDSAKNIIKILKEEGRKDA